MTAYCQTWASPEYSLRMIILQQVGYIVGLGDRHSVNILMDQATAEVVHIDLGVAFEQGLMLKTPERVRNQTQFIACIFSWNLAWKGLLFRWLIILCLQAKIEIDFPSFVGAFPPDQGYSGWHGSHGS